jgi:two-component system, cell cycle response regulator DivK
MRIVYVEDNIANVHLVKRVARMGKHEIINYIDGMDAFNNFDTDNPDLVLMDIQLAGELTGIEVVKKLRDKGYVTPIFAVTAYAMVGDRERCMEAGCTGYISKPIPIPELVRLFKEYEPAPSTELEVKEESPASDAKSTEIPSASETDRKVTVKTVLNAANVIKDDATARLRPVLNLPDTKETSTLVSLSNITSDEPQDDGTQSDKPAKPASDSPSKETPSAKSDENQKDENVTTVTELDNSDAVSLNTDKPAQTK